MVQCEGRFLVLGVSVRDAKRAEYFYRRFLSYMEERHGLCTGREERREKWLMPRIPPGCPIYYGQGRVLCAGEAAGFLNRWARVSRLRWRADIMQPARLWSIGMSRSAPGALPGTDERLRAYMRRQWSFTAGMAETFREMRT